MGDGCRLNTVYEIEWTDGDDADARLERLLSVAESTGILVVRFSAKSLCDDRTFPRDTLSRWSTSRAVTVADIRSSLANPALELALLSDLVYLRESASLRLPDPKVPLSEGLVRCLSRVGSGAFAAGALENAEMNSERAVQLGVVHGVLAHDAPLPLPDPASIVALTAARDLMRCSARGVAADRLEIATFRFLVACGEPAEGARAFLEKRVARFGKTSCDTS